MACYSQRKKDKNDGSYLIRSIKDRKRIGLFLENAKKNK